MGACGAFREGVSDEAGAESADGGASGRVEGTGVPFVFDVKYITPFPGISKNIPSVGYMDGIWISCECGYLKPEREAYVDFFRKMKIEPQESYFVDDSPANIEAGIRLGMRGCVYHQDMPELRRNLREAGIDLKDA